MHMQLLSDWYFSFHRLWTLLKPARIRWQRLHADGKEPVRSFKTDAGFDVVATESLELAVGAHLNIGCGIAVQVGPGWSYNLRGRSGLSRRGIIAALGLVDASYCGELRVVLSNLSGGPYHIAKGDRVAQVQFSPVWELPWEQVDQFESKSGTRGANGWGSSGK